MKKFKNFIMGFITATLLLVSVMGVFANGVLKDITAQLSYEIKTKFNGEEVNLTDTDGNELEPILYNGRTYLPVRSLCEKIDINLDWENETKTILLSTKSSELPLEEQIVATINSDTEIYLGEVNLYLLEMKNNLEAMFGPNVWEQNLEDGQSIKEMAENDALESARNSNVAAMIAKEKGIKLTDSEMAVINETAQNYMSNYNEEASKINGINSSTVKITLINQKLLEKLYSKEMDNYKIDEETLNTALNLNTEYKGYQDNGYEYYGVKAKVKHILFSTLDDNNKNLTEEQKAEVEKQAEKILAKAKKGEDFAELAKEYSQDFASKDNGGEYTFARGQMVPEFEEASFSMKPGEIKLIETMYGYHIIKLEEIIEATSDDIEKVKAKEQAIIEMITNNVKIQEFNKKIEKWVLDYKIEINNEIWDKVDVVQLEM
ncbi:hypothetical protein SH1V18_16990 [Vallitalea longa]|uniref:PpiC domain-containing protein n=1 Tax=Vallitalea longa TaxID=2936439 RepID=A0A9W5Y9U5_9FIRM|nr:peptidylprolyl isomerase [Vallitalea longa]GKX29219.1 hypothetical protein SH1V18_16990 [Vallitalea longa]